MKLKKIIPTLLITSTLVPTIYANEDVLDVEKIQHVKDLEIISITKISDPTSRDQFIKDVREIYKKRKQNEESRDNYKKKLDELNVKKSTAEEAIKNTQKELTVANATNALAFAASSTTTDSITKLNDKLEGLQKEILSIESEIKTATVKYQEADLAVLESPNALNNLYARYTIVLASFTADDVNVVMGEKDLFNETEKEDFKKRLETEIEEAKVEKQRQEEEATKAREALQQAAEEARRQEEAEKAEQARSSQQATATVASYVVGGNFEQPDPTYLAAMNGGAWGNCTYYVYNRVAQLGHPLPTPAMGNANQWAGTARSIGLSVSHEAKAGRIAAFAAGVGGASPTYGHVAFVEQVYEDGSILISEMNSIGLNVISTRTLPASLAAQVDYIDVGI